MVSRRALTALAALTTFASVACGDDGGDAGTADAAADVVDVHAPDTVAPPLLTPVAGDPNFARPAGGWYRGDLHYHTDFSEDAARQGGDPLALALDIAAAYDDPTFLAFDPSRAGNALDFIAVTDHRQATVVGHPDFVHDTLILIAGEEYGGGGHASVWGISSYVSHEPAVGQAQDDRHLEAIAEARGQGALFSINHPGQENLWNWSTDGAHAVEVFNGPWAGFWMGAPPDDLNATLAERGVENPFIWDAHTHAPLAGHNDKALRFWQNHLTAGRALAVVGGSDRHMLLPAALPTTYVLKPAGAAWEGRDGKALGSDGILEGIRQRRTFVSRSPFGAQVALTATAASGETWEMGAIVPMTDTLTITARVGRATGGVLRLVAGPLREPDADGRYSARAEVLFEAPIEADLVEGTFEWAVPSGGGWLHAVVLEPLAPEPLPTELQEIADQLVAPTERDALVAMASAILPLIDPFLVLDPASCDPAAWDPWRPQCMPVDDNTLSTFYIPDGLERILHRYFEDGQPTDFCMGAVSSAFLVRP